MTPYRSFATLIVLISASIVWVTTPILADEPGIAATATTTAPAPFETITPVLTATDTATPTATETSTPTPPATATSTATLQPPSATPAATATTCTDTFEPNPDPGQGALLVGGDTLTGLTLYPAGDADFFRFWGKTGGYYQVRTTTDDGVDTHLAIFSPSGGKLVENDDPAAGNPAAALSLQAVNDGWYIAKVSSLVPIDWGCRTYRLTLTEVAPTATPRQPTAMPQATTTATPHPTAIPAALTPDDYEPNYNFETAANLGVGQTVPLNFNSDPPGSGIDHDFFRFYVKGGQTVRLETTRLAAGLDTNLILYNHEAQPIAGNDDCGEGVLNSCLDWHADYTGLAYVAIGPVGMLPEAANPGARDYDLVLEYVAATATPQPIGGPRFGYPVTTIEVNSGETMTGPYQSGGEAGNLPGNSTGNLPWTVNPVAPTATPLPTVTPLPTATPTPALQVRVNTLTETAPTATPAPLAAVQVILSLYYDRNNNRAFDPGEGVSGISVRLLDSVDNRLLGHTLTDHSGYTGLTVASSGAVRLSIPYLGHNEIIRPPGDALVIRLAPLQLPAIIP